MMMYLLDHPAFPPFVVILLLLVPSSAIPAGFKHNHFPKRVAPTRRTGVVPPAEQRKFHAIPPLRFFFVGPFFASAAVSCKRPPTSYNFVHVIL